MRRTKIVCTIGPATRSARMVRRLIAADVDVFRINFSHGNDAAHHEEVSTIRREAEALGRTVAILQDLPGPKMRVGKLREGKVELTRGSSFLLTAKSVLGDETRVSVNYPALLESVRKGDAIHLADGLIRLRVEENVGDGARCTVIAGGTLSDGKGVNAPGVRTRIGFPTAQDLKHLAFGLSHSVDFIALSFVRSAENVRSVRRRLGRSESAQLIAKVEKREAVENFDSILKEADGIMVARGDLGIEMPIERVPVIQKEIVEKCNQAGKPVIVATQMLASMVSSPIPTRAEATDVSTAVLDGADAVMLSDETAVGRYPLETVRTLDRIARASERGFAKYGHVRPEEERSPMEEAIAKAACRLAHYIGAKAIVAPTQTGSTAGRVSKYRPEQPIIALCTVPAVARRMKLYWGVVPVTRKQTGTTDQLFSLAESVAKSLRLVARGDKMVMSSGTPGVVGSTDLIKVIEVGLHRSGARKIEQKARRSP
ncbi:MAG: pyruvate kinase [Nitrososphaerales archaeon]|nr:pyruvate kinase [Nitrososphaerales archaeon]